MFDAPIKLDLSANRFTPYRFRFDVRGSDLTGCTFAMQIRARKDGGWLALQLNQVGSAGVQGLVLSSTVTEAGTVFHLELRIERSAIVELPFAPEPGDNLPLLYDIHAKPEGGVQFLFAQGAFTVLAGVTEVVL